MNVNKVFLAGHLTREVELRHTQGGTAIAKFGLAVNERWSKDGETKEKVHFVDLVAFGKTGEAIAQFFSKGKPIFVEGRLNFSSWETDEGEKRSKLEVTVDSFQFVGAKEKAEEEAPPPRKSKTRRAPVPDPADGSDDLNDIPF